MSSGEEEGEIYAAAPLDIQIEIIKRLPIKPLIKFLSVSKSWKSIIRSPPFIADYNRIHIQPRQFFVVYPNKDFVNIYDDDDDGDLRFCKHLKHLPRSPHLGDFKSIGYSQGLFGFHNYKDSLFIWNPSIRKSVPIPVMEIRDDDEFGFTVVSNNATEPTIFKITYVPRLQVHFYTLSTRIWTTMSTDRESSLGFTRTWVVIDRFIYWIAYYEGDRYLILSFDITNQHFSELCLPPPLAPHPSSLKLGLSKHKESLVVLERYESKQDIGVWMMMMEPGAQNSFRKLYTIKAPPYPLTLDSVLGFRKKGRPITTMHVWSITWTLFSHKPSTEGFKHLGISGKRGIDLAGSYMETLLLLDH